MTPTVLLLVLLAQTSQPPPPRRGEPQQQQPSQPAQQAGNPGPFSQTPAQPPIPQPLIVKVETLPPNQEPKDRWKETREWGMVGTNFALVIITGVLASYAYKQWKASAKAADAAKLAADAAKQSAEATADSVAAFRVSNRQWVDVDEWSCDVTWLGKVDKLVLDVTVRVTNNTPLPLTLRTVRCTFGQSKGGYEWLNHLLPPKASAHATVSHILNAEDTKKYRTSPNDPISVIVAGWVHFWDVFDDPQSQIIGRFIMWNREYSIYTRGVAGLHKRLGILEKEWPLIEPDETGLKDNRTKADR